MVLYLATLVFPGFSGRAGSGKTNLMLSLLTRPEFYAAGAGKRHYFDRIVLMGPTVDSDDLYKSLDQQKVHIESVLDPTPQTFRQFWTTRRSR
jgi:hypothetical protein